MVTKPLNKDQSIGMTLLHSNNNLRNGSEEYLIYLPIVLYIVVFLCFCLKWVKYSYQVWMMGMVFKGIFITLFNFIIYYCEIAQNQCHSLYPT